MSSSMTSVESLARTLLDAAATSAANPHEIERLASQLDALTPAQRREVAHARDISGRTILHHACLQGNVALVRRLLAAGADLRAQDGQLQTPLHLALKAANDDRRQQTQPTSSSAPPGANPQAECAVLILDADEQQSAAPTSSEGAEPETKRAKLAGDGSTSAQTHQQSSLLALADSFGRLPLHWAVAVPSLLIRCLRPELLDAQTASGDTAAHWAAQDGNLDALDTLLSAGARLDLANARHETPADVAKTDATRGVIHAWRDRRDAQTAAAGATESKESDAGTVSVASLASKSAAAGGARMTAAAPKKKLAIKMKK